jgi:hypothetical protein
LKDKYHESIFFLLQDRKTVDLFAIRPEDQAQKFLMMRILGNKVLNSAVDAVISLGEFWTAPADPLKPYQRAGESPDRQELLAANLITKGGVPLEIFSLIERDGTDVRLGETQIKRDGIAFLFAPVYQAWGRPIPTDWLQRMDDMFGRGSA